MIVFYIVNILGWWDVILMFMDCNWEFCFKEGDVVVFFMLKFGFGIKRKGCLKDSKLESVEEG